MSPKAGSRLLRCEKTVYPRLPRSALLADTPADGECSRTPGGKMVHEATSDCYLCALHPAAAPANRPLVHLSTVGDPRCEDSVRRRPLTFLTMKSPVAFAQYKATGFDDLTCYKSSCAPDHVAANPSRSTDTRPIRPDASREDRCGAWSPPAWPALPCSSIGPLVGGTHG